eukprot:1254105-Pyramimonas_sp.AAC.1
MFTCAASASLMVNVPVWGSAINNQFWRLELTFRHWRDDMPRSSCGEFDSSCCVPPGKCDRRESSI